MGPGVNRPLEKLKIYPPGLIQMLLLLELLLLLPLLLLLLNKTRFIFYSSRAYFQFYRESRREQEHNCFSAGAMFHLSAI